MTREEQLNWLHRLRSDIPYMHITIDVEVSLEIKEQYRKALSEVIKSLEQEPCEDCISRKSIKQKLQEHHDFFVNAYGGFSNLPQNDKSRVDEITNCIAMVVNEPSVTPQELQTFKWCTTCKEYDQEKHCCHRWSKVIRDTVEEIKQEQEPIKALGEELRKVREGIKDGIVLYGYDKAVAICDKYLSETEADNGNDD